MRLIDGEKLVEGLRIYKREAISVDGLEGIISLMPSAEPKQVDRDPEQIARDIATIIENEKDMRVILKNSEPEIIRCKNCRYNHDCDIQYHAQAGEEFYCGAAERKTDEWQE